MTNYKRVAIYFLPKKNSSLDNFGKNLLGRDINKKKKMEQLVLLSMATSEEIQIIYIRKKLRQWLLKIPLGFQKMQRHYLRLIK